MTSKERLIATTKYQEVDHIPLCFRTYLFKPPPEIAWKDQYEEARKWISMGLDHVLLIQSPLTRNDVVGLGDPIEFDKDVRTKVSAIDDRKEEYPILAKEYHTPEGILRQEVRKTRDWDYKNHLYGHGGDNLILFDDYNVPRSKKFLIEKEDDLKKLKYLFTSPSKGVLNDYKKYVAEEKRRARELGLLNAVFSSSGTDTLIWLCGVENAILMAYDKPEMFEDLLEIIHQRDTLATKICLDLGIDMIIRRAWYEGCNIWSPTIYRRYFLPKIKEIAKMVHEGNKLLGYVIPAGIMPILSELLDINYDLHWYIDDVQDNADFKKVKQFFSGKIALLGGVNEAVTLESGSIDAIKKSVYRAVETLGKGGGFILSVVDALYSSTPWESVKAMIGAWKEVRDYM